jgi:hypothetical protein
MKRLRTSSERRVLEVLRKEGAISLERLLSLVPEFTWNQVFVTVDELSRRGEMTLSRRGFDYELAYSSGKEEPVSCTL